jgi:CRP-like cAMP-binding protein
VDLSSIYAKKIALFDGISEPELSGMLHCLGAIDRSYKKGSFILMAGDPLTYVGIVLSGQATVFKTDLLGSRTVLGALAPPHLFAETFVCAGVKTSPVTVEALTDVDVLLLMFDKILHTCTSCCSHHSQLIHNMLRIVAQKNLALSEKLDHMARKTTRQKLASYLIDQATRADNRRFEIALDRQALADYLRVNRSALSRELSRMNEEGAVDYQRNSFYIRDLEQLEEMLLHE